MVMLANPNELVNILKKKCFQVGLHRNFQKKVKNDVWPQGVPFLASTELPKPF